MSQSERPLEWYDAVELMLPSVFRISTPQATGTGFLVSQSTIQPVLGVATAAHVVDHAHWWEQPIRIEHYQTGWSTLLRATDRAIIIDSQRDTAALVLAKGNLELPAEPPKLIPDQAFVKVGAEIGWLGFPAVYPSRACFFSGRVSSRLAGEDGYLVDGVAINGVSGGPTMLRMYDHVMIVGVVSAYIANRATGETLPGLSVVQDVSQFQELVRRFKSVDEAKQEEAPLPPQPPPPNPEGPATQ